MKKVNLDKIMMYAALILAASALVCILYLLYEYSKTGVFNPHIRSLSFSFVSLVCSYIVIKKCSYTDQAGGIKKGKDEPIVDYKDLFSFQDLNKSNSMKPADSVYDGFKSKMRDGSSLLVVFETPERGEKSKDEILSYYSKMIASAQVRGNVDRSKDFLARVIKDELLNFYNEMNELKTQ